MIEKDAIVLEYNLCWWHKHQILYVSLKPPPNKLMVTTTFLSLSNYLCIYLYICVC